MAFSKRKLMQEDKRYLLEKIHRIEERQHWLISRIQDIPASTITEAKKLLGETDRKKFGKRYKQVNSALETSLSTLVLLTASFPSSGNDNGSDSSSSTSTDSHLDSASHVHDDDISVFSSVSTTTVSSHGSVTKSRQSLNIDGSLKDKRPSPADLDITRGRPTHCMGDDVQCGGRVAKSFLGNPRDASAASIDVKGDANPQRSGMQYKDQESHQHVGRPLAKSQTDARLTEDSCLLEGRGSVSPLHEYESGTSSNGVIDVSNAERFESAVEQNKTRVPPGFRPLEGSSTSTNGKPNEAKQNREVSFDEKSGYNPKELRENLNSNAKKVVSQGSHQHDGSGYAQPQTPGLTPPEAHPSNTQTFQQAAPQPAPQYTIQPILLPDNQQAGQQLSYLMPIQSCPVPYRISKEKQTAVIMPLELKVRGQIEVVVSEIKSPALFWIQLAESPLSSFSHKLNLFYSDYLSIPIPAPDIGTFCCACFTEDNSWYRARIVGVQGQTSGQVPNLDDPAGITVDVIYVDYGNRERLNLTRVRVIHPEFTRLPAQSVCCSLAKIKPPVISSGWTKEQTYVFKMLVLGKIVQANVQMRKDHRMPSLDMSTPVVAGKTPSGDRQFVQIDVAQAMVEREMAQYITGCGPPSAPLQPKQPQVEMAKPSTDASVDPSSLRNTADTKGEVTEDSGRQVSSKAENTPSTDGPDTGTPEQKSIQDSSGVCKAKGTRKLSSNNEDNCASKESTKQTQPRQANRTDEQQQQNPKESSPKSDSNHDCDSSKLNVQTGSTSSGYSDLEANKTNPFPKSRHSSVSSWRKSQQSGTKPSSGPERHQNQSDVSSRRHTSQGANKQTPDLVIKPRESTHAKTTTGSPPARHSPPYSKNECSPSKAHPGGSRRQGAWSGRGNRLNNPRQAPQPHNLKKTEQQMHQRSQSTESGSRDMPTNPQTSRETDGVISKAEDAARSEQQENNRYVKVEEQSVNQKSEEKPGEDTKGTSSPHKEPDNLPEEIRLGRISPNSSSGVSSCNSGQSDISSVKKTTAQSSRPEKEDVPSKSSVQENSKKDVVESGLKDIIAKMSSGELEGTYLDSKRAESDHGMEQAREAAMEGLNKPLSASSKNLSSSTSSFFSAVTELDSFQTNGSPCRKAKVSSIRNNTPSSESVNAENRNNAKLPPSTLELHKRDNLPTQNGCVRLAMSHIVSPQEFYVHLVTHDATKLDYLGKDLNSFYNSEKVCDMSEELILEPGTYCAAKYAEDGDWYRAKILDIQNTKDAKCTMGSHLAVAEITTKRVQLMYVDFGNKEWQAADALKPLQALFYELPGQVIKCCLAHINPPEKKGDWETDATKSEEKTSKGRAGGWSADTVKEFAEMTGYKNMLLGRLTREYNAQSDEPLQIILLDPSSPWEICINQELVNRGLASSPRFMPAQPQDSSESKEITKCQLLKASEGWHLKKYVEGGYDPVPQKGHSEVKGQVTLSDQWDPMVSDFESNRNSYNIDTDDPGVATVGYKAESTRQLCKFYSTGRVCYRGNQCPYEHAKLGEKPLESVDVFCLNNKITPPPAGSVVALEVTALYSAFHFWAQLPYFARPLDSLQQRGAPPIDDSGEETLELLEESLNQTYTVSKHRQITSLLLRAQGEMVCCRCPQDQRYYRARVIEGNPAEETTQIFYVDYGNTEWVPSSDVHDIQQQFLHLPLQAVECRLVGVRPLDYHEEARARPDEETRKFFEEMVANKTLVAHIVYVACNGNLEVELYDTNGKSDVNIGEALIENGLAFRESQRSNKDPSISSEGRGSIVLEEDAQTRDVT